MTNLGEWIQVLLNRDNRHNRWTIFDLLPHTSACTTLKMAQYQLYNGIYLPENIPSVCVIIVDK